MTPTKEQPVSGATELVEATRELRCPHCRGRSFTAYDRDLPEGGYVKTLDRVRCVDCKADLPADDARTLLERQEQVAGKMALALEHILSGALSLPRFGEEEARQALREYHEAHHG